MTYDTENNPEEKGTGDSGAKKAVSRVDFLSKYEAWTQDMRGEGREYGHGVKMKQFFFSLSFCFLPPPTHEEEFCAELVGGRL